MFFLKKFPERKCLQKIIIEYWNKTKWISEKLVVNSNKMSYCDFVAGCIGGSAGIIVGHPLDTLKVILLLDTL